MLHATSLTWARFPAAIRRTTLLQALLIVGGSVLLALSARMAIPVPFSPVPITGQTFVVLALAGLLGRKSAISAVLYLGQSALGLPILAGNLGGLARFAGPTGGYLMGFVLAAYVAGWLAERSGRRSWRLALALLAGQAMIYLCGLLWLGRFLPAGQLLAAGLFPFLAGDACKLVASVALVAPIQGLRSR